MTRHGVFRVMITVVALVALSACAVTEAVRQERREALVQRIANDTVAYNEAYNSAISAQILLNILRAYNRQPRQYMSMSGFSRTTPDTRQTTIGIGDLPLGQLGQEWGNGSVAVQSNGQIEPEYTVSPFGTDAYDNIALYPTSPEVFRYYWNSGWNRDLLLLLLVDRMDVSDQSAPLYNSAGTIAANCHGEGYTDNGCAFVGAVRDLVGSLRSAHATPRGRIDGACYPLASYNVDQAPVLVAPPEHGPPPPCPTAIVVGARTYTLHLRALDDVIYYVGELMRPDPQHPPPQGVLEARLRVGAPSSPVQTSPLFRIVPADADTERDYAATVTYEGRRYSAGAPVHDFCYHPGHPEQCNADNPGDRSGSVLELLIGLLAHNQSDAAVRAPQSRLIEAR